MFEPEHEIVSEVELVVDWTMVAVSVVSASVVVADARDVLSASLSPGT